MCVNVISDEVMGQLVPYYWYIIQSEYQIIQPI